MRAKSTRAPPSSLAAADDQFALASDGTLRWLGDAVGKLTAADNVLEPRIRLVADDRLSGAPRESVQARLDLWLKAHLTKLLGPLFELSKAEDVTGIARGIAFQLVEALGVIERQKIAAEMKDLDQNARAMLRKYGVRFGAYHIYLPALLKPAARSFASQLWSLKHDNVDLSALTSAQHLASTGRTSFPADKALDRDAYRMLGYRLAGERAVRVDILERLADLIRPALAWRAGSTQPKPAGAFDGRSFTVTQAMTSLTGSAGEDFASILRALGYRMDRRPPLPPQPAPAAEAAVEQQPAAAPEAPASGLVAANDNVVGAAQLQADIGEATSEAVAPAEAPAVIAEAPAAVAEVPAVVAEEAAPAAAESDAAASTEVAADAVAQSEPAGRRSGIGGRCSVGACSGNRRCSGNDRGLAACGPARGPQAQARASASSPSRSGAAGRGWCAGSRRRTGPQGSSTRSRQGFSSSPAQRAGTRRRGRQHQRERANRRCWGQ